MYYNVTLRLIRVIIVTVESSNTYSECVLIDLGIQHAMGMPHIVICSLPGSTVFFLFIS